MNNAFINKEIPEELDSSVLLREKVDKTTEIIEALQNIAGSNYWKVLENVFEADLSKAKSRLAKEKDTTEIFRLQGEIRWGEKFDLEKLLEKYRNELLGIRKQL